MCFLLRTEAGSNRFIKIAPRWVRCLDQLVLSFSAPGFYLLFPCYRSLDIWCFFKIDQLCDVIFGGKTIREMVAPMFCYAALQIVGHADIKGYIGLIGHDINVIAHGISQPPIICPCGGQDGLPRRFAPRNDKNYSLRFYRYIPKISHLSASFRLVQNCKPSASCHCEEAAGRRGNPFPFVLNNPNSPHTLHSAR